MFMKSIILAGAFLLLGFTSPVFADCTQPNSFLSQNQINSLLGGRFACGQSTSQNAPGWNESHSAASGGNVIEQHEGGATVENVGTWNTSVASGSAANGVGRVTYAYTGGVTPAYGVAPSGTGITNCNNNAACIVPGNYNFCGVPPAPILNILVSATASPLSSCPSNP
jgi:hypothetical protein